MSQTFEYVQDYYGVPAKRGRRVRYTGGRKGPKLGTITAPAGAHVRIRLDGEKSSSPYHPTWELEYLDDDGNVIWPVQYDTQKGNRCWFCNDPIDLDGFDATGLVVGHVECADIAKEGLHIMAGGRS